MRFALPFTLLFSSILICNGLQSSGIKEVLPVTEENLQTFVLNTRFSIQDCIEDFENASDKSFDNRLKPLNQISNDFLSGFSILQNLAMIDYPSSSIAFVSLKDLFDLFHNQISDNPRFFSSFLSCIENGINDPHLSPYHRHILNQMLLSCDCNIEGIAQEDLEKVAKLQAVINEQKKVPFLYLKGRAEEKKSQGLSVLTLNTCFMEGNLSLLYGGVKPWKDRIFALSKKILSIDADVVCLQECFAQESNHALYDMLKGHYSHFYINIAPRPLGLTFSTLGFPGGLFVASKYPIEKPHFTFFSAAGFPMNWGVFDFTVKSDMPLAHIYTTHLQSLSAEGFPEIRSAQFKELIDKMQKDYSEQRKDIPFFLCGDLNISLGTNEPAEALISAYFYDDFNKKGKKIDKNNMTWTDLFLKKFTSSKEKPTFEILDYALLLQNLPTGKTSKNYGMKTTLVPICDLKHPDDTITDHNGLLTTFKLEPTQ